MFKQRTGIEATHIPYRGIGASFTDMMSGKVQFAFSSIAGALPFTSDNRVRPLATTGLQRSSVYPDLPTVDEAGLKGFEVDLWLGVFAPSGIPADVLARLNSEIGKALRRDEVKSGFGQGRSRAARHQSARRRHVPEGRIRQVEDRDRRGQHQGELMLQ
jgi:tripartite-type tricarboxylate transporter receptor subunit TctC